MHSIKRSALPLLLLFLWTGTLLAQSHDYASRPVLDFLFGHMDLRMTLNPGERSLSGEVAYEVTARAGGRDTLALDAAHMEIERVRVDGEEAGYRLHNDSLFVAVADSTVRGDSYRLAVTYRALPRFGLLKNDRGTVWTSQLPLGNRHWVPLPDHPRVSFTTAISVSVPSGYRVTAPGRKTGEEVNSVDRVTFTFESGVPLPASSLAWAAGPFRTGERTFDAKRVALYSEEGAAGDSLREVLLNLTVETVRELEGKAGMDYPYERLSVVLLDDHHWETKTWGAGVLYLYRNLGPLRAQLRRAIAAQWFGVYQREEQWSDAEAMNLYQMLLAAGADTLLLRPDPESLISHGDSAGNGPADEGYSVYGPQRWNSWQRGFPAWPRNALKGAMRHGLAGALERGAGVYRWEDYAESWYRETGQPQFTPPPVKRLARGKPAGEESADSVVYRVDYRLDEQEGRLVLAFTALEGMYGDLTAVRGIETAPGGRDTTQVTFTGRSDSVAVSVSPMLSNFHLEAPGHPRLRLLQHKPAPFLIWELRNAETEKRRVEAARSLGDHPDNPDLQLAIQDFLGRDASPRVRAALLTSLAEITGGASGTEQRFLDALGSSRPEVRRAALAALRNYPGNAEVRTRVERFALNRDRTEMFRDAARVLSGISAADELSSFTDRVVESDTSGQRAIFTVSLLAGAGAVERAVAYADQYLSPVFSYEVRARAIRLLNRYDRAAADWISRAEPLLDDPDPRVRYLAARALGSFDDPEAQKLLEAEMADEYDARVRFRP